MDRKAALRATIFALTAAVLGVVFTACGSKPPAADPTGASGSGVSSAPVGGATGEGATSAAPTSLPASTGTPPTTGGGGGGW